MKITLPVLALLLVGCGSDDAPPPATDAMTLDGALDAASPDAVASEAGAPDASSLDASSLDASSPDASRADASRADASRPDASRPEAGLSEAGVPMLSCTEIETVYEALVGRSGMRCGMAGECHVVDGHCSVGLGGCYYAVTTTVTQESLDEVSRWWTAARCHIGAPVCDCGPRPRGARCDSGGCLLTPS